VLDNLGKGAAGQAVRNLELMLGIAADSARLRTASVGA
jgi:N-acetyl-gamma-glutamylphosphate reductase